jgi:C-terminal region of band_7
VLTVPAVERVLLSGVGGKRAPPRTARTACGPFTGGQDAMKMRLAQEFIAQWGAIAKESSVMIVPQDMGDLSKAIGTALRITETVKPAAA